MACLLVQLLPMAAGAAGTEAAAARQRYLDAEGALRAGDHGNVERYLGRADDYPLRPYLERDLLQARLGSAPAATVRAFVAAHGDAPFIPPLQRAWLRQLGGKQAWNDYLHDYRRGLSVELDCQRLQALLETGRQAQAFEAVPELWVYGRSRPDACDPAFDAWIEAGQLRAPALWARIEAAFAAGELRLVRYLRDFLSQRDRRIVDTWIEMHREPAATLAAGRPDPAEPRAPQIAMHGLQRWARYDPRAALDALPALQARFGLEQASVAPLARSAALLLAARREPDARRRLQSLPASAKDASVYEWLARASMTAGDWRQLLADIEQLPTEAQASAQWQYWRARALAALGRGSEAEAHYRVLAVQRDYYGFLSAQRLDLPYRYGHRPLAVDPARSARLAANDAVRRARELLLLDREPDARREWNYALRDAGADDYRAAAQLADSWGWHSAAILTVAKAQDWDDLALRFPVTHRDTVLAASRQESLEPQWVFAVLRQESAFQSDARSSAGAMGLMQVMPATAKLVAKTLPRPLARLSDLYRPDVNIPIGTRYLRMSRQDLYDSAVLATAGYNAGPRRVAQWLPEQREAPADLWVETVPYQETRGYLRRVMEYSVIYEHRLGLEGDFLRSQMQHVPGRGRAS